MNKLIKDYEKHFFFNSLNAIKYFCRVDNEKASNLIVVFGNLLNYMIFDNRNYVNIFEELEQLSSMKFVQEIRFDNEVVIIKEESENTKIPKGIILYIFLLGYNLNILRFDKAKIQIRTRNKAIRIKMISNLELNIEQIKQNAFFQKIHDNIINLNCNLSLSLNGNELNFDISL